MTQKNSTLMWHIIALLFAILSESTAETEPKSNRLHAWATHSSCASSDPDYENTLHVANNVFFSWTLESDQILKARVVYNGVGWVAFGISDEGEMVGSEAVIGLPDMIFEDEEEVMKFDLDSKEPSGVVPMENNMQTLIDASLTQTSNETVLSFKKKMKEDGEKEILAMGNNVFLWAVGSSNTLGQHGQRGVFHLDLSSCETYTQDTVPAFAQAAPVNNINTSNKRAFIAHGTIAACAWLFAAPFAISASWFRQYFNKNWIFIHVLANVICFFLTLIALIIAFVATEITDSPKVEHFSKTHHIIGTFIMMLITVQIMGGIMRPPPPKNDNSYARQIWHITHRCNGLLLLVLATYNMWTGISLYSARF